MPPSVGGVKEVTDYFKLFDYDINLLITALQGSVATEEGAMDSCMLQFLAAPFVASLILTGIHAYLGVHVVERGVIFVDLSLAQIAALGAAIAMLLPVTGGDAHAPAVYWISLGFTFIGALVFSTIRGHRARIPQEAVIGICYAVASAATILAMSKATSESEHLKDMLVGNILAVSWPEVGETAALWRDRPVPLLLPEAVPRDLDGSRGKRRGHGHPLLGLSVLRVVRVRGDLVGRDCRRAARVLLSDRPSVAAMLYADTLEASRDWDGRWGRSCRRLVYLVSETGSAERTLVTPAEVIVRSIGP